jgi:cytochrome c peroxidase
MKTATKIKELLMHHLSLRLAAASALALSVCVVRVATGQTVDPPPPPSLKTIAIPEPANLAEFISDRAAAIRLGKALFWDMQVGSDAIQACASCHFHAGADSRANGQLNPGTLNRAAGGADAPDLSFGMTLYNPDGSVRALVPRGADYHLRAEDFPTRKLANPFDRASSPLSDSNDIVGSQGVFNGRFIAIIPGFAFEWVDYGLADPDGFRVGTANVRRVEPRHTPSVINAVFNSRNFWDARAQNEFNGVNNWGTRDANAKLYKASGEYQLDLVAVSLINSALASQAVTPPTSRFEMAALGRSLPELGRKLAKLRPLAKQAVHPQDAVLGPWSRAPRRGLRIGNYQTMIRAAFHETWWKSERYIRVNADATTSVIDRRSGALTAKEYSLMEYNFSLFFGLALQAYQATLVSDDAPYDRYREGTQTLSAQALEGLEIFLRQDPLVLPDGTRKAAGRCINCHGGPEFTDAAVGNILAKGETRNREGQDLDRGWNNIGVRTTMEDVGAGGNDLFGNPLSVTRLRPKSARFIAVDGSFKVPSVRNAELTAPYFHNGGYLTLEDVVDFYSRGGDFAPIKAADGATEIRPLSVPIMTESEKAAVVAFLKTLTDERVRYRKAPFDHPQLFVPDGQTVIPKKGIAYDNLREIAAVGRDGGAPLPNFLTPTKGVDR